MVTDIFVRKQMNASSMGENTDKLIQGYSKPVITLIRNKVQERASDKSPVIWNTDCTRLVEISIVHTINTTTTMPAIACCEFAMEFPASGRLEPTCRKHGSLFLSELPFKSKISDAY